MILRSLHFYNLRRISERVITSAAWWKQVKLAFKWENPDIIQVMGCEPR